MSDFIQPSSDARATAIAVAYSIVKADTNVASGYASADNHKEIMQRAELVGQVAQRILALTLVATSMRG